MLTTLGTFVVVLLFLILGALYTIQAKLGETLVKILECRNLLTDVLKVGHDVEAHLNLLADKAME